MNNPFQDPGVAVYQDGECVQRPGLFNRLVRHVEERAVFGAIYGLPRVGKTSLVFRLIEHFRESEIMFVYIDLDAVSSDCHFARFWYDARKELCSQLGISNQESLCKDLSVERDAFLDTVVEAKRRGRTVVLVVDEFCTCLKYPPVEANAFIANFRSLMSGVGGPRRNLRRYFCCLTLSRRRPEKIQSMTGGSTLAGTISERFEVGVFTHDEFENQCAMVPDMTADQVWPLSELTHRHPYVAALVDKVLFSKKCSVDAAWDKVSSIVSGYYDDVSKLIAEATESGVYVPDELKDRCRGGSHLEHCTKDVEIDTSSTTVLPTWDECEKQKKYAIDSVRSGVRRIIFVHGERGSGKTHFVNQMARAMQVDESKIVLCSCAEWRKVETAEHQLTGSVEGAFTDARDFKGVCARANGGVLFLDEICKLPVEAQNILLKILDEQTVRRMGGSEDEEADFLLVCASWEDPADLIEEGQFSMDLKERIDMGISVELLPLGAYREKISEVDIDSVLEQVLKLDVEQRKRQVSFNLAAKKQFLNVLRSDNRIDFRPNWKEKIPGNWRFVRKLIGEMVSRVIVQNRDEIKIDDVNAAVDKCVAGCGCLEGEHVNINDDVIVERLHGDGKGFDCDEWTIRAFCEFVRLAQEHADTVAKHKGGYGKADICRDVYKRVPRPNGKEPTGETGPQQQFYRVLTEKIRFDNYESALEWALGADL